MLSWLGSAARLEAFHNARLEKGEHITDTLRDPSFWLGTFGLSIGCP